MRIPEIKARLVELAYEHDLPELLDLSEELLRRKPERRAPTTSVAMDTATREKIRQMALRHPDLPQARIAAALNVNPGRVSESLRGYRT